MKIYLSGPMTGLPDHNFPAFHAEAARLRALGYEVTNPAELNPDPGADWHACLRTDIRALTECDTLALLPGWQTSSGAHLEMHLAHRLGMEIVQAGDLQPVASTADALLAAREPVPAEAAPYPAHAPATFEQAKRHYLPIAHQAVRSAYNDWPPPSASNMADLIQELVKIIEMAPAPAEQQVVPATDEMPSPASNKPQGWLIDWPGEPELGHYFAEEPSQSARSRPLYLHLSAADGPWRPMDTAPQDGTLVRLLVEFEHHHTEDLNRACHTIGACCDHGGEKRWQFAGWDWSEDRFTEGLGQPKGWLPFISPDSSQSGDADLQRDAERYRWLRKPTSNVPISHLAARDPETYDAAVDAARAKGGA